MDRFGFGLFFVVILTHPGCGAAGLGGPSREQALRAGEETCRPIIAALENFHSVHGQYPDGLDELVRSKLLDKVPDTPEIGDSKESGVTYEVCHPLDLYRLRFSYDIPDSLFGSIVGFTYLSDEREWRGRKYGATFWSETCDRAAKRYRENPDEEMLGVFIAVVIAKPDWSDRIERIYESRVKEWLGEGEPKAILPDLAEDGRTGTCYGPNGGSRKICFTYRPHLLPMLGGEMKEFPIMDTLYEIEAKDGVEEWRVLLKGK